MDKASIFKKGWREVPLLEVVKQMIPAPSSAWVKGECHIIYSMMEDHGDGLWNHVSISCHDRYPTWEEILDARYAFFTEDDEVFQILPPKREYNNLHPNCFHLWHKIGHRLTPG